MGGMERSSVGAGLSVELPTVHSLGRVVTKNADEKDALKSFEAYIVGEMLQRAAPQNPTGLFDGGQAGRMYQDHLYQEFARLIAEKGDFGLARQLEGSLDRREQLRSSVAETEAEMKPESSLATPQDAVPGGWR